jgi:hypothetical protein
MMMKRILMTTAFMMMMGTVGCNFSNGEVKEGDYSTSVELPTEDSTNTEGDSETTTVDLTVLPTPEAADKDTLLLDCDWYLLECKIGDEFVNAKEYLNANGFEDFDNRVAKFNSDGSMDLIYNGIILDCEYTFDGSTVTYWQFGSSEQKYTFAYDADKDALVTPMDDGKLLYFERIARSKDN